MDIASVTSIGGLAVSLAAAFFAWKSADSAKQAAKAADRTAELSEAQDRRDRTPNLEVALEGGPIRPGQDVAIYTIVNVGREDLDSVVVHQPKLPPGMQVDFPVAATDGDGGWAPAVELGPVAIAQTVRFTLSVGTEGSALPPRFEVVIRATVGDQSWAIHEPIAIPDRLRRPVAIAGGDT